MATIPQRVIEQASRDRMIGAILVWRRFDGWAMHTFHSTRENALAEGMRPWPDDVVAVEISERWQWEDKDNV